LDVAQSDNVKRGFVVAAGQTEGLRGAAMETQSIFQETGTGGGRMTGSGLGPRPASTCPETGGTETSSGLGPGVGEGLMGIGAFLSLSVVGTLLSWMVTLEIEVVDSMVLFLSVPVPAPEMLLWALLVVFLDSRSYSLMKMPVKNIADQM
jgi:hypothetical protein